MTTVYDLTIAVHVAAVAAMLLGPLVMAAIKGRPGRKAARRVPELELEADR